MLLWGLLPSFCWFVACAALAVSVLGFWPFLVLALVPFLALLVVY